ncbi:MAG: HD domain-containing protein [Desulfobacteraceae bacterium]|nr:MAG: HD domain-containing protein [Desulfobacteraceae bacterium]
MNQDDVSSLKNWFAGYVSRFYSDDPEYNRPIHLKEEHTKRVCGNIVMIGKELGISPEDMILAEIIALFHDVGRFRQYELYRTFVDALSENHARMGLRQIGKHKVFSGFPADKKFLISKAIAYHNAAYLPAGEDERTLFFMKLIRDSDKLDIWKVSLDYFTEKHSGDAIALGLPDTPSFSEKILESIQRHEFARIGDLKTLNDFKLLQISWVFDINFIPSFRLLKKNNYLGMLEETLPRKKEISEAVKVASDYVDSRLMNAPEEPPNF